MRRYYLACVALGILIGYAGTALAGRLDPRLAALKIGSPAFLKANDRGIALPWSPQATNPFLPRVRADGTVQVYIRGLGPDSPLPTTAELDGAGARSIQASPALDVVQAWVPISNLSELANLPNVGLVTVPTYAMMPRPPHPQHLIRLTQGITSATSVATGLAIDQAAVQAMQANKLQAVGAIGTNVKVGIISNDNSGLSASQAAGYLPATVWADPNYPGTTPTPGDPAEGTAMLEEVHAMAPGASLGFCGPQTTVDFLTCYSDFATWGADVIADDLSYSPIDMFTIGNTTDSSFAYAVTTFTQSHPNIAITSSAGNDGYNYFEAPYTPGPSTTIGSTTYPSVMDFGAALGRSSNTKLAVYLPANYAFRPILEWNDLLNTSPDNLILYLVNSSGTVLAQGTGGTTSNGRPEEGLSYTSGSASETDYLIIACQACSNPITIKLTGLGNGAIVFGSNTYGSEDAGQKVANGVMATAAAYVASQSPLSINREAYSDTGPFLYGNYGATGTVAKPEISGIDGVLVSGAGGFGSSLSSGGALFCGTSATSPNVGALIASLMQASPGNSSSFYYSNLEQTANQSAFTATSVGNCGSPNSTGYSLNLAGSGLAQGFAALSFFYTFPKTALTQPISVSSGQTGTYTVPVNLSISYSASVQSGSNTATASNCVWTANSAVTQTGATVAYMATGTGTFQLVANCPDNHGISSPTPPTLAVNAQTIPAPTVVVSNATSSGFVLTLSGYQPLTVSATSSNTAVLSASGISISPSTCGTSTLICTVSLSPVAMANGTTQITVTATDQWSRTGTATQSETYSYTPPPSGGGGGGGAFGWLSILGLLGFSILSQGRRRTHHRLRNITFFGSESPR